MPGSTHRRRLRVLFGTTSLSVHATFYQLAATCLPRADRTDATCTKLSKRPKSGSEDSRSVTESLVECTSVDHDEFRQDGSDRTPPIGLSLNMNAIEECNRAARFGYIQTDPDDSMLAQQLFNTFSSISRISILPKYQSLGRESGREATFRFKRNDSRQSSGRDQTAGGRAEEVRPRRLLQRRRGSE